MVYEDLRRTPICLTVPGYGNSGPAHWQTIWEEMRDDCARVELGCWSAPVRNVWINRIDQAVGAAAAPVVLVAHSLGCLAVAWWAGLSSDAISGSVRGALLVAPPDVDRPGCQTALSPFAPTPRHALPFPSIVVGSTNDPYCTAERAEDIARGWLSDFVLIPDAGHINATSGLGAWREGQELLDRLIDIRRATGAAAIAPARHNVAGARLSP